MRARNRKTVKDENERKGNKEEEQEEQVQNRMKGCKQGEEQCMKGTFEPMQKLLEDHRGGPLRTSRYTFPNNKVAYCRPGRLREPQVYEPGGKSLLI